MARPVPGPSQAKTTADESTHMPCTQLTCGADSCDVPERDWVECRSCSQLDARYSARTSVTNSDVGCHKLIQKKQPQTPAILTLTSKGLDSKMV